MTALTTPAAEQTFEWRPHPAAAALVNRLLSVYVAQHARLGDLSSQMLLETGTRLGDWLDHLSQDTQRQRILAILLRCDYSGDLEAMLNEQQQVDDEHMKALEMAFAAAAANGQLTPCWTPGSAASALRWMMKGLCTEWLLYGRRFDIARQGKEGLRRLFQSFTRDPADASVPDVRSTELP